MATSWCRARKFYTEFGIKAYRNRSQRIWPILQRDRYSTQPSKTKKFDVIQYTVPTKPGDKKDTKVELPVTYSPQYVEAAWYDWWVNEGFFTPKETSDAGEKFVICLPPPNVTGTLHLGHALTCAIQDAIVRWNRMHGRETVWVPGCDHAGIATQVVVEKQVWKKEGKTRHDLGREEFLKRVWKWKESKGDTIYNQMKKLGASLDWTRTRFTMDESMSEAVREAFIRLHDDGLIYRDKRLVNWCCHLRSTISDIEVINQQIDGPTSLKVPGYDKPVTFGQIVTFAYPVVGTDDYVHVSTTRLETMLGDTAVAVHPEDNRYGHLIGAHVQHPVTGRHIPIVADDSVDKDFGTGAVKITPSHDHNDYSIGLRHNLLSVNIINDRGEMDNVPEPFNGMKRFKAREKVADFLKEKGLLQDINPHSMVLPLCQRTSDIVEPRIKEQWYVKCDDMVAYALEAVNTGALTVDPEYHKKVWNEFLRDEKTSSWCISRQLWWGHRIPAYRIITDTKGIGSECWVSAHTEDEAYAKAEQKYGISRNDFTLEQDEDVLDTWFSSGLFPFSVFGWPKQTVDLARFYPNSLLETGSDILFFWVARMVMLGYKMTGQLPFSKVLLHGTLRDAKGRKMSKSLGNVIDPMDVIYGISLKDLQKQVEQLSLDKQEVAIARKGQEKDFPNGIQECGTDALRFALCSYQYKDAEIRMNITHVLSYRHFCNKIWQSFKFIQTNLGPDFRPDINFLKCDITSLSAVDQWMLSTLSDVVHQCDKHFVSQDLQHATSVLYTFWWNDFCAIYLEYAKRALKSEDGTNVKNILFQCADTFLRALSPFMPYLTEELYQRLGNYSPDIADSICVAKYPHPDMYPWFSERVAKDMELVKSVCSGTLSIVKTLELKPRTVDVYVQLTNMGQGSFDAFNDIFETQLRTKSVTLLYEGNSPEGCLSKDIEENVKVFLRLEDMKNVTSQLEKLAKSRQNAVDKIEKLQQKQTKSKPEIQGKIDSLVSKVAGIDEQIEMLKSLDR